MDKALLNFLAIIIFIGTILYVLPVVQIDVGASISHLTLQSFPLLPTGFPFEPVPTLRPIPTLLNVTMRPTITPTPVPTASPTPTPTLSPTPTPTPTPEPNVTLMPSPTPSPVPESTASPSPSATTPLVLPTSEATITPSPIVDASIIPGPVNVTLGPVIWNVTATPEATGGNVTERVGTPGGLAMAALVILALLIVGAVTWNLWKGKK